MMALAIIIGILFFLGLLLTPVFEPGLTYFEHSSGYAFTLLTGGFILSSMAYRDLGNPLKRYNYLTLPVSTLERFLSMWLLTSIGWVFLYTFIYALYSLFANAIGQVIFTHITFETFNPLSGYAFKFMKYYVVLHGIFLAGAAEFRGFALPKTLLALVIFGAVCGGITYLIMKGYFDVEYTLEPDLFAGMPVSQIWKVIQWMFWWLFAPISWIITYLGLKEQEV